MYKFTFYHIYSKVFHIFDADVILLNYLSFQVYTASI